MNTPFYPENYDIIEPLEFLGAIMWPKAIMGIGKTFITKGKYYGLYQNS